MSPNYTKGRIVMNLTNGKYGEVAWKVRSGKHVPVKVRVNLGKNKGRIVTRLWHEENVVFSIGGPEKI